MVAGPLYWDQWGDRCAGAPATKKRTGRHWDWEQLDIHRPGGFRCCHHRRTNWNYIAGWRVESRVTAGKEGKVFTGAGGAGQYRERADRQSGGWGKSVCVRVDLGGRRIIKKNKNRSHTEHE